jgi:DNA repair exonuclease SbcCD ATPase subunit
MTYQDAHVEFPAFGLVLVSGSNLASQGRLESVGSGKTALGEAVCRALTGTAGRFSRLGDCSTRRQGNLYVKVEAMLAGKPLLVELGFKCPELSLAGEGLRFTYDGKVTERGHIGETRAELSQLIQVTPELARWAVFIDGDRLRFNDLSEQAAVSLLMEALAQPPWTRFYENSKKAVASFKLAVSEAETAMQSILATQQQAENRLEQALEALRQAEKAYAKLLETWNSQAAAAKEEITTVEQRVKAADAKIAATRAAIEEIEAKSATAYHELEIAKRSIVNLLTEARRKQDTAVAARSDARSKRAYEAGQLQKMLSIPKNCPTCGQPWTKAHAEAEIEAQRQREADAATALEPVDRACRVAQEKVQQLESEMRSVDDKMRATRVSEQVRALSREAESAESEARQGRDRIRHLELWLKTKPEMTQVVQQKTIVSERQDILEKARADLASRAKSLVEAKEALGVVQYWNSAFSPSGIPNMVLQDSISPLNSISRRLSNIMTGSTIEVSYDTRRELATGAEKAELVINVANKLGSAKIEGSSKGEAGLTNLIVAETLSEIGRVSSRIGLRWYDEVLNSQDRVVRQAILAYLQEVAHRLKILIFVVDHHAETGNFADHVLLVEKSGNGVTAAKWSAQTLTLP